MLKDKEQQMINYESESSRTSKSSLKLESNEDQVFSIKEPMEYGMLGKMFWGRRGQ